MNVAEFYAPRQRTQLFSTKHSGLDLGHDDGTAIPSPVTGVVADKGWNFYYGFWVAIEVARGVFVGWAHMKTGSWLVVGQRITVLGTTVGLVGHTGWYAKGDHAHLYRGPSPRPQDRPKVNPLGTITAAITVEATQDITPDTPREKDDRMYVHGVGAPNVAYECFTDAWGSFRLRPCSANESAIVIGAGKSELINDDRLTQLGIQAGWVGGKIPTITPPAAQAIDYDKLATAIAAKIPTVDLDAVLEATETLPARVLQRLREFWAGGK